ncbi:MAG: NAD-dependent epimerase/dehydratase family protein [Sphingomonas sp.]|nr:NAD-dependent epimerase/dehydratase family protein [Sphingomonas sp.]
MKRVLVTGAHGFTAQYLLPRLIELGSEIHGLARPGVAGVPMPPEVTEHVVDLTDLDALTELVGKVRPDVVIHLAGISFVAHSNVREIYDSNLVGSRNLLQALVDANCDPSAVLLASSANVYGNQRQGVLTEETPPQPVNDYGISKLAMEFAAGLFVDRLPIIIVRPFNYTGVGQSMDFVIPKIVDHVRRRASTIQLGNLDVERDFSDVRGVVDCYLRLIESPQAIGRTFNVCSGRGYTLNEVIELVQRLSGHSMTIETNPSFVRGNEVKTLYGDNQRLISVIGDLGMPSLEATLKWMIEA